MNKKDETLIEGAIILKALNPVLGEIKRLPDDLAGLEELISGLQACGVRSGNIIAIAITHSREIHFKEKHSDISEWLDWAQESFGFNRQHIHHMRQVGEFLLECGAKELMALEEGDAPHHSKSGKEESDASHHSKSGKGQSDALHHSEKEEACILLMGLPFNKLFPLSRLIEDAIYPFLKKHDVESMNRDEIRDAVNAELGEPVAERKPAGKKKQGVNPDEQFVQLTFRDYVNTVAGWEDEEIAHWAEDESVNATNAASAGMRLLNISVCKLEDGDSLTEQDKGAIISMLEDALESFKHMEG